MGISDLEEHVQAPIFRRSTRQAGHPNEKARLIPSVLLALGFLLTEIERCYEQLSQHVAPFGLVLLVRHRWRVSRSRIKSIEFSSEKTDELDGALQHHREVPNNGKTLAVILNRNLCGEINIRLKIRISRGQTDCEEFYAVVSNTLQKGGRHTVDCSRFTWMHADCRSKGHCATYDQQEAMLVDDAPIIEKGQKIQSRIWTHVWLHRLNQLFRGRRDSLNTSALTGRQVFFSRGADGKLVRGNMSSALFLNQGPHQMIKGRPKQVDNLATNCGEPQWDIQLTESLKDIVTALVLKFFDYSVRVRMRRNESFDLRIEILDVLFGHFNLGTYAV